MEFMALKYVNFAGDESYCCQQDRTAVHTVCGRKGVYNPENHNACSGNLLEKLPAVGLRFVRDPLTKACSVCHVCVCVCVFAAGGHLACVEKI